jgi:hypothetical protein
MCIGFDFGLWSTWRIIVTWITRKFLYVDLANLTANAAGC